MRCLVTGGGTGGHIYPAVAVAKEVREILPRASVLYVGTGTGMESSLVPKEGLDFEAIRSSGIVGKSPLMAVKGIYNAALGMGDARRILKSFRPDVVLGTGGYVSGPVVLAARLMGIPCAIQEQNAVPGKTNLALSKRVDKIFAAWEYSLKYFPRKARVKVTGNPVKASLFTASKVAGRTFFGLDNKPTLLVLGGSRGAQTLVEATIEIAGSGISDVQVLLITGRAYYEKAVAAVGAEPENGIEGAKTGNIIIRPYVYKMEMAYKACDLVLGRAGGMTLAEITALGLPSIIVPSPNVVGNHQEYNARALEEAGAAVVIREGPSVVQGIRDALFRLIGHSEELGRMSEASKKIGRPDAARDIARELIALARR